VVGVNGFVGRNLYQGLKARALKTGGIYHQTGRAVPADCYALDAASPQDVRALLDQLRPRIVINAAGYKDVAGCEEDPARATMANVAIPGNLAARCRDRPTGLIHLSTDLVFDCEHGDYAESDLPRPRTIYGLTKLHGEQMALRAEHAVVLRSGGIYGPGSPTLDWLERELLAGHTVDAYADLFSTPTSVDDLTLVLAGLIDLPLNSETWCKRCFHAVGPDRVSRYDLFATYAKPIGKQHLVRPAPAPAEMIAIRRDASLRNSSLWRTQHGISFRGIEQGLADCLNKRQ
jgi:dTDP-4-dehydrorhamnose reductase